MKLKDEYLILATNVKSKDALGLYKRRWEIETLFSAFKRRGFNLEETHMSNPKKLDTLFTILAFLVPHLKWGTKGIQQLKFLNQLKTTLIFQRLPLKLFK